MSLDRTADDAIRCLRSFFLTIERRGIINTVGWAGATIIVGRMIANDNSLPCDADLFERYLSAMPSVKIVAAHIAEESSAIMGLYHPKSPNPWPMYRYVCNLHPRTLDNIKRQSNLNYLGHKIMRTMFLLQLEGAAAEANEMESRLIERFQLVWRRRDQVIRQLKQDPKLKHLLSGSSRIAIERSEHDAPSELFAAKSALASRKTKAPVSPTSTPSRSYSTDARRSGSHLELSLENATVAQVEELLATSRRQVENSSPMISQRRELAARKQVGAKALNWLQRLQGLDDERVLSK